MKSLSQSEYGELRSLYQQVYASPEVEITEEFIDEIVEELFEECVAEGYTIDEAAVAVEEAATEYLMELNPYAPAGSKEARSYAKSTTATKRGVERKAAVKGAVERAKAKVAGAKEKIGKSLTSAARTSDPSKSVKARVGRVSDRASDTKKKAKSGIKGFIKRQAEKVVKRMSEEVEALKATGKFTEAEIAAFASVEEGYKEIDAKKHGRMYDRYKKLRTAAMKDADETGEASGDNRYKMGKMQGVISKSAENLRKKG